LNIASRLHQSSSESEANVSSIAREGAGSRRGGRRRNGRASNNPGKHSSGPSAGSSSSNSAAPAAFTPDLGLQEHQPRGPLYHVLGICCTAVHKTKTPETNRGYEFADRCGTSLRREQEDVLSTVPFTVDGTFTWALLYNTHSALIRCIATAVQSFLPPSCLPLLLAISRTVPTYVCTQLDHIALGFEGRLVVPQGHHEEGLV